MGIDERIKHNKEVLLNWIKKYPESTAYFDCFCDGSGSIHLYETTFLDHEHLEEFLAFAEINNMELSLNSQNRDNKIHIELHYRERE